MKIDFHVHLTPPEIIGNWEEYAKNEPYFSLLSSGKKNKFVDAEDVVAALDNEDSPFDKAVVFGFAFNDVGLCRLVNDYVIDSVKKYADRLIGFCVVPSLQNCRCGEIAKEIERCYSAGLKGVGELFPAGQGINLEDKSETDKITGVCKELGLPLLLHINELVGHQYPGKTDAPLRQFETFIVNNPGLNIVLAHLGGGLMFYETMPEIKKAFTNVYYDTAAAPFLYDAKIYSVAKTLGLCRKILFGSDFPLLPPSRYMNALNESSLTNEDKQLILGGNAVKLLEGNIK